MDEGKSSYAEAMLKFHVGADNADAIADPARQTGANPDVRDAP